MGVIRVVELIRVVHVIQVVHVFQVVRMISLDDMPSENILFSWSKPSNY